jgi:hypothetical protein
MIHQNNSKTQQIKFLNAITATLQNHGYPNRFSSIKVLNIENILKEINIEPFFAEYLNILLSQITQSQNNLFSNDIFDLKSELSAKFHRIKGVIGGHPERLMVFDKYFLKKLSSLHSLNEPFMYHLLHEHYPKLKPFLAKVFGVIFVPKEFALTKDLIEQMVSSGKSDIENVIYFGFKE